MKAELKAKWIEALRSGEFKQATHKLHDTITGGYCCLGVLCRVAGLPINDTGTFICDKEYSYEPIWELTGNIHASRELPRMNDGGKSFARIADYIEANIPTDGHSVTEAV